MSVFLNTEVQVSLLYDVRAHLHLPVIVIRVSESFWLTLRLYILSHKM